MLKQILRKCAIAISVSLAFLYCVNAAILFFAQPANIQYGAEEESVTQYGAMSIVLLDNLKAGGIGHLASGTTGYVNVLSEDPIIYLNGTEYSEAPEQTSYIYRHEMAHVLQKRLTAQKAGGYPSIINPFVSFAYYGHLVELDRVFSETMPEGNEDAHRHSLFSGLEAGADCFAQTNLPEGPLVYIGSNYCDLEQRTISLAMLSDRWPVPMTDEEKIASNISITGTGQMQESK